MFKRRLWKSSCKIRQGGHGLKKRFKKVVLAYSGGLDTSVIVKWLIETYRCEVIAFAADVGQKEELTGLKKKAIKTGASKIYIDDLREEFARDFVFPALRANAIYEGTYLMGTSLARPLIAKRQIEIARMEGADAVCHGSTGKGNDQVRFELTYIALDPSIRIISAWKDENWIFDSRKSMLDYAEKYNIPVPLVTREKPYSSDRNLLHISHEGGILEDPWAEPPEDIFILTVSPEAAPDKATYVEIEFECGNPVAVNGKKMSPARLMDHLNQIAGANGIGRVDMVENRLVGLKSRGIYECPAATLLYTAHRELETIALDRETYHFKESLAARYGELVYNGQWFSPLREALKTFVDKTQTFVTGKIKLQLYKGNISILSRTCRKSLYSQNWVTFEADSVYNQADATGFINLYGLPLRMEALLRRR